MALPASSLPLLPRVCAMREHSDVYKQEKVEMGRDSYGWSVIIIIMKQETGNRWSRAYRD